MDEHKMTMKNMNEQQDIDLELLRILKDKEKMSQRELSSNLGISLGKVNFILKALADKGIIKVRNFKNNKNKRAYAYFLTPKGIEEKAKLTINFFKRKTAEYDKLNEELKVLREEVEKMNSNIDEGKIKHE
jgi:EPS-associated MarR family transcriptional regulator